MANGFCCVQMTIDVSFSKGRRLKENTAESQIPILAFVTGGTYFDEKSAHSLQRYRAVSEASKSRRTVPQPACCAFSVTGPPVSVRFEMCAIRRKAQCLMCAQSPLPWFTFLI